MTPVELSLPRLMREEGFRSHLYIDTVGKHTLGYGFNVDAGISSELAASVLQFQVNAVYTQVKDCWWWHEEETVRGSVILDLGFNVGVTGLLHFPRMIAAYGSKDWQRASDELMDSDAARELPGRYHPLADILLNGKET